MEINSNSPSRVSCLEDEILDPRVQIELENLNAATDEINRLEAGLEEANNAFRISLNETSVQLQVLSKKLGSCVEKARPYYEAREKAKSLQLDCQRAAVQYQRANAVHQAARETISLAEDRFAILRDKEGSIQRKFNSAWQEMLNHATMKIVEAEAQKAASEREHHKRASAYTIAEIEVQELEKRLKSAINKSTPYFNHRTATQIKLEAQKDKIYKLQKEVTQAKDNYSLTLRNLEHISEEIHELRRMNGKREPGVGAEFDQCEAFVERAPSRESLIVDPSADREHEYWSNLKDKLDDLKSIEEESPTKNQESMELSSNLVSKDGALISCENFDHDTTSEGLNRISLDRKQTNVNENINNEELKPNGDTEATQSWCNDGNDNQNRNQEIIPNWGQESFQFREQEKTENWKQENTKNWDQEVAKNKLHNQISNQEVSQNHYQEDVNHDQINNQEFSQNSQECVDNQDISHNIIENREKSLINKYPE